jgi:peptidyl-dipeptidase Dcp
MAPKFAAHSDAIRLNPKLFARLDTLFQRRSQLGLDPESLRLLERTHNDFVRSGARLSPADQGRLRALNAEIATLQTTFSQNVLKETNASSVLVDRREELAGLTEAEIAAAATAAQAEGHPGKYALRLLNTSGQPVLATLANRAVRERVLQASLARGSRGGEFDNRALSPASPACAPNAPSSSATRPTPPTQLADQTAGTTGAVNKLLAQLTPAAVANARRRPPRCRPSSTREGGAFRLAAWDWSFYAEKVRQASATPSTSPSSSPTSSSTAC